MGTSTTGKVLVSARIENLFDWLSAKQGRLREDRVRRVEVPDALIDPGAAAISLPKDLIVHLGLYPLRLRRVRTGAGLVTVPVYGAVRLTVQGRDCTCDVVEVPEGCPVRIGKVPLLLLDFVIDPWGQRLIGNPAHGGEQMIEMY